MHAGSSELQSGVEDVDISAEIGAERNSTPHPNPVPRFLITPENGATKGGASNDFKEDDLEDQSSLAPGSDATGTTEHQLAESRDNMRLYRVFQFSAVGTAFLCSVCVLVTLVLVNVSSYRYSAEVEHRWTDTFLGPHVASSPQKMIDWYSFEENSFAHSFAQEQSSRFQRSLIRVIDTFLYKPHTGLQAAVVNYTLLPGAALASETPDEDVLWAAIRNESILVPALGSFALSPSLVVSSVAALRRPNNRTIVVGVHARCNLWNSAPPDTSCLTLSVGINTSSESPIIVESYDGHPAQQEDETLHSWRMLVSEVLGYDATQGSVTLIRNNSLVIVTGLANVAVVASIMPLVDLGRLVGQDYCPFCSGAQRAQLNSFRKLKLASSLVVFLDPSQPAELLLPAATAESSFGFSWPPLTNVDTDLRTLQVLAASNTSRTFANGPLVLGDRRLLISWFDFTLTARNHFRLLVSQDVYGALNLWTAGLNQVLGASSNLRKVSTATTVVIGVMFFALCSFMVFRAVTYSRMLREAVLAMVENLHVARTMELEKATVFTAIVATDKTSPTSASRQPSPGDDAVELWSVSGVRGPAALALCSIPEVRRAQEAMNMMFKALREYRKFLPSTLFVKGEVPLQEELAEELLLAGLEGSSYSRPVSFRLAPSSPSHGQSPRMSPIRGSRPPSFRVKVSSGKPSPASSFVKLPSSTTPRGSRVNQSEETRIEPHPAEEVETAPAERGNLAFCLKRRKATILTVIFAGFLRTAQEDVGDAHRASQTFLQIVLSVVDRNNGIVLSLLPDKVVATWNAFRTDSSHEANGAVCAYEVSRTLQAADEEFLFSEHQVAICVTTGPVVAGNTGTTSERASVVHGNTVNLCSELLSLLVAINVRCAVTRPVADRLPQGLWAIPVDIVTDEDDSVHEIFELRSGDEPPYVQQMRQGFQAFGAQDYNAAKTHFAEAVKASIPRVEPNAMRLLKLSVMFARLHTPYVRALPAWQRFEMDQPSGGDSAADNASPKRRYKSEKRKSQMADEQLRLELMNLRSTSNASPSPRRSMAATEPPQSSPRPSPRSSVLLSASPCAPATSVVGNATGRRRSKGSPMEDSLNAVVSLSPKRASAAMAPSSVPHTGSNSDGIRSVVKEFRDKKDMMFRISTNVLGRGAVGEVLMGMSESGGLVAIKSVPLPSFIKSKQGAGKEDPSLSGLSEIQKRRLKRKGVNVNDNIEQDLDAMLNEVAMLSRLRHENIVGYLSSAIVDQKLLVVMEYISGGSLHSLISEFKGMPAATAKRYLRDTLKGLQYLHASDIVHRDIKPQNVLILIDGSCKLTDFGTSQRLSKLSSTTAMEGTPQYMAPEASKGRSEKASDVWSFGILMAQLLTGELPWPNDGFFIPMRFIYMLGNDQTMVPTVTSLSPDAQEIVTWCCQREPAKRPTVDQLLAHSYFASVVSTASPLALRGPMKRRTDRGRASVPRSTDDSPPGLDRGLGRSGKAVVDSGAGASLPNKSHATSVTLFKFSAFSDLPPNTPRGNNDMVLDDRVNLGEEEEDCEVTDRIPDVSIEAPAEDTF